MLLKNSFMTLLKEKETEYICNQKMVMMMMIMIMIIMMMMKMMMT